MVFLQAPSDWSEWLFFGLQILISVIATLDILLRKNDVRAAIGWIGAVWFAPILGGILYYLFGINRVTRRAARLSRGQQKLESANSLSLQGFSDPIAKLSEIGGRVAGHAVIGGNKVAILRGGDEAYPAMLQAIEQSTRSIAFTSYIFRNDVIGQNFVEALVGARQRGVEVRVLLDSIGAGYFFPKVIRKLVDGGVAVEQFLHTWIPWRMPFLNMRNHRKILVCDGTLGFTGGMNVGSEYTRSGAGAECIDDIHFRVEGPIVRQFMETFAQDWAFTSGEDLRGDLWWPDLREHGRTFVRGIRNGPDADIYKVETLLGAALSQARSRVRIVTPYFLPGHNLQFAIMEAILRGVRVEIVLPQRSDQVLMDWAMRGHLRMFRRVPAQFYLSPPPFDHSKLVTVDGEWCLVGSSNWDIRSHRLNFEFDLECYDADLVSALDRIIDAKISAAQPFDTETVVTWPKWIQLRNAAAHLFQPYL